MEIARNLSRMAGYKECAVSSSTAFSLSHSLRLFLTVNRSLKLFFSPTIPLHSFISVIHPVIMSTSITVRAPVDRCAACTGNMSTPRICEGHGRDLTNYGRIYQVVRRVLGPSNMGDANLIASVLLVQNLSGIAHPRRLLRCQKMPRCSLRSGSQLKNRLRRRVCFALSQAARQ